MLFHSTQEHSADTHGFSQRKGQRHSVSELLVTQSALSALRVVSLGLYSHHLINPWDSLILQSSFPPGRLLPSRGSEHPGERWAGGGAGWAWCQARRSRQCAGLPGSQAGLPVCSARGAPPAPGFRHGLIRTFLWVQHRIQLFTS